MKRILLLSFILFLSFLSSFSLEKLTIQGKRILHNDTAIFLRGANTIAETGKISESDAENFKAMGMNFVRLIIDIDTEADWADTEGDGNYIKESALNDWETVTSWFTTRKIWVVVEMRSNDYDLADTDFWVPGSALHGKWRKIWITLAARLKNQDYIAAWAILAEHGQGNRTKVKDAFRPIMESLDSITGGNTPFSFGPKLNSIEYYDTANYTDWYWPEYANRIIYQINHLHPKPYINNDTLKGYDPATWWYHRTDGQDGDGADNDDSMHKAGTEAHLAPGLAWRDFYNAPIYIDQWGCAFIQPGYMDYERDMLDIFRENDSIPNTRWTYYMANERGIMTEYYGTKELHAPLTDFFTLNYTQGMNWPYEIAVSNPNAADNHITTEASNNYLPWNIDFKFSSPFACNKIELWSGNTGSAEDPTQVEVLGSNDNISWTLLATISGISFSGRRAQYFSPSFSNSSSYQYYRANIIANGGGSNTVLSNLEFFPAAVSTPPTSIKNTVVEKGFAVSQWGNKLLLTVPSTEQVIRVAIINASGQLMKTENNISKKAGETYSIDIAGFKPGIYMVSLINTNQPYSQKIIIR